MWYRVAFMLASSGESISVIDIFQVAETFGKKILI